MLSSGNSTGLFMFKVRTPSLNGRRIAVPVEFRDGDCVMSGGTRLTFHHPEALPQNRRRSPKGQQ
jgi:alkylated DNA repair dioxygenase AlkB